MRFRNNELNYSLVVEGQHGLELYTEKYLQVLPLSNTSKLVYLLESLAGFAGIYILNRNEEHYLISVVKLHEYTDFEVESTAIQRVITSSRLIRFPPDIATKVCPEKPLVFPLAGTKCFNLRNGLMIQGARSNSLVFFDLENPYFEHFWHLHKNLILASLFALHIKQGSISVVLLYQLLLNSVALWRYNLLFIGLATIYTLSVATVISKLFGLLRYVFSYVPQFESDKELIVLLLPNLLLLKRGIYRDFHINEWYAVMLSMFVICGKSGSVLCWILIYLNFDFIVRHEQALLRFLVLEASMLAVTYLERYRLCRNKLHVLNMAFIALLHLYAEEELWLVQQLIEGYVIVLSVALAFDYVSQRSLHHHHS